MQKLKSFKQGNIYLAAGKKAHRILGIDPGTATVGYGVLDCPERNRFHCVASGVIQTPRDMTMGARLGIIRSDLISLIVEYDPDVLVIEAIFFARNAKTLVPVAQARGVILEAAAGMSVPTVEYSPMQVKLTLTGFGKADKRMVQESLARVLNHEQIIKPDDAADAVAIAICHARMGLHKSLTEPA